MGCCRSRGRRKLMTLEGRDLSYFLLISGWSGSSVLSSSGHNTCSFVTKTENQTNPCAAVECQRPGRHPGSFMVPPIPRRVANRPPALELKTMPCAASQFWESTRATLVVRWWPGLVSLVRWSTVGRCRIICRSH